MRYHNEKLSQYKEFLKGKSASVIGVGISNVPLIEFLLKNDVAVTARDMKDFSELCSINPKVEQLKEAGVNFVLGENYLSDIKQDIVYKSPGIRFDKEEIMKAVENGSIITSEMEAFLSLCPSKIIAVTGSDGKTTTTTLIAKILESAGKKVWLGGNIGRPLLSEIESITPDDFTQKLAADQVYLIVEYTYTHGTSTSSNTLATPLPVDIVSEWAAGNAVTYSAEISMEQDIKIDTPKVEPWGTEQVGGTIIIR